MDKFLRRNEVKHKSILPIIYVSIIVLLAVYSITALFNPNNNASFNTGDYVELKNDWTYRVDGGASKSINLPQSRNVPEADDVSIFRMLPDNVTDGTYLSIYSSFQDVTVFIGGNEVYSYNGTEGLLYTSVPVTSIIFVPMNSSYSSKSLTIHYSSPLSSRKGVLHMVYLGNKTDIIYRLVLDRIVIIIAGLLLLAVGAIVVLYKTLSGAHGIIGQALQYQGIYMFFIGIFFVLQSGMNQVFFNDLNWSRFLEFYSVMMIPPAFILEIDVVEKHIYMKFCDIMVFLSIIVSIVQTYLVFVLHHDFMESMWLTYIILGFSCIFAIFSVIAVAINHRELWYDMKWVMYAFLSFILGGIIEIIMYYVDSSKEDCRFIAIGVLAHFLCTMRWIVLQKNSEELAKERSVQQAEAKSSFLANMSHEIRTPVHAIIGLNDMILKNSEEEKIRGYSGDMKKACQKLLTLINNILEFSKIESGKMKLTGNEFELMPMVNSLEDDVRTAIGDKRISLVTDIQQDLPSSFIADGPRVREILWNVLQNAAEYTENGSITLKIYGDSFDNENENIYFSISDTGCGMNKDTLKKIFINFNEKSGISVNHGIGLGLEVAGNLSLLMGGNIIAKSTEGFGSEFIIKLCLKISESGKLSNVSSSVQKNPDADKKSLPALNILAVDDNIINLKIFKGIFENTYITVDTAESGKQALAKLQSAKYDIVFLDHVMPKMDGTETLNRLKHLQHCPNINTPVVMFTSGSENDTKDDVVKLGFTDILFKPVKENEIIALIQTLVSQKDRRYNA